MRFTISKTELSEALSIASKGRSARATLPILSGIYLRAEADSLILQSTDLEISVRHTVNALVEEPGEAVVSGKIIVEIVKNLPDAAILCHTSGEELLVDCMNSHYAMKTLPAVDFPAFPSIEVIDSITLPAADVSAMVKKVSKAVSRDESHAILTGINLTVEEEDLTMAATDSYRLAIAHSVAEGHMGTFALIVPGSTFDDVCRLLSGIKEIEIGYSENQISFSFGPTVFITRKLEGNYPNYKQIIPKAKSLSATVDTQAFTTAIKRVSVMAQEYMQIKLEFSPDAQQIVISSRASDQGAAEEKIDAQIEGEEITIGFNYQYIMDGLTSIETEEVVFEANDPLRPGVIKASGGDEFFYLSMPVKLNI